MLTNVSTDSRGERWMTETKDGVGYSQEEEIVQEELPVEAIQ